MELPDILEKIIVYLKGYELYLLMKCSKTIREIIGHSSIWKYRCEISENYDCLNIEEVFKIFLEINIFKKRYKIRSCYGKWFYLYILTKHTASSTAFWGVDILYKNRNCCKIMYRICGLLGNITNATEYYKTGKQLNIIMSNLEIVLYKIKDEDKYKILSNILISIYHYTIRIDNYYFAFNFTDILMKNIKCNTITGDKEVILKILHYISLKLDVNYDIFKIIFKITITKNVNEYMNILNNYLL